VIEAVVFDLDGVLVDTEQAWDASRRELARDHGGRWREGATEAMQGMSSPEWASYLRNEIGVQLSEPEIVDGVLSAMLSVLAAAVPLLPGAAPAVERLAARWPLGLASSANREVIDAVLGSSGLARFFAASVSSEEVRRGKPAPDVYLEAAARLAVAAERCVAVEDSANGIRSASAAGMLVVALPNPHYPPPAEVLGEASLVLEHLDGLSVEVLAALDGGGPERERMLDEEEVESFPASDPHSDWAGPPD
jgi:HAD superfamily hydrolase (TIGR01509 family)